jgi:hypothetical protein
MPLGFRIAIGRCDCATPYRDSIQAKVCEAIRVQLETWLHRLPGDLDGLPDEAYEDVRLEGDSVTFGTYRHAVASGETLVVFQAFVRTWAKPTFLGPSGVGRMYAEGLLVSEAGTVRRAPDELMWPFR